MNHRAVVGLVGLPGSGKSTVASFLDRRGARVLDADRLGHDLLQKGTEEYARLVELLGDRILAEDGMIDRSEVASLVFQDRTLLEGLNRIVHPRMIDRIRSEIRKHRRGESGSEPILVIDAALLLEWGLGEEVDEVVVVTAPPEMRARRVNRLRGWTKTEMQNREEAQWSEEQKTLRATQTIDNNGTIADLEDRVAQLWRRLQTRARIDRK